MEYYARMCFLSVVFTFRCVGKILTSCLAFGLASYKIFPTHLEVNTTDREHTLS